MAQIIGIEQLRSSDEEATYTPSCAFGLQGEISGFPDSQLHEKMGIRRTKVSNLFSHIN
jgi:hypothetical protein